MASSKGEFSDWFNKQGGQQGSATAAKEPAASSSFVAGFWPAGANARRSDVESKGAEEDTATESSSFLGSFVRNPFSSTPTQPQQSDWTCGLTTMQRFQLFVLFIGGSLLLFFVSIFVFLPMVVVMPSKFATTFTIASLLAMAALAFLRGPKTMLKSLLDRDRLLFTTSYIGSLVLTLYATFVSQSYLLIILAVAVQIAALLWYAASYVPGGTTGMGMMSQFFVSSATSAARGVAGSIVR
jgi:hypothetical protein